ncbi:MAG: AMP-binding protein [Betaproteobacteria bacterium]|nr:AMP-binding protein [Betaproteobacteria bacterium]
MISASLGDQTVGATLADRAARHPERTFIHFRERSYSYGEIDTIASRIARGLHDLGCRKGSLIAVLLPNCAEYVFLQFGIARAGMVQVPLNTEAQGPLLAHFLDNAMPELLVTTGQFLPRIEAVTGECKRAPRLVIENTFEFERLIQAPPQPPEVDMTSHDLSAIFYTSGTTGVSKGVMLAHRHNLHLASLIAKLADLTPQDVFYSAFPYYHGVSQYMAVLPALVAGASAVIAERFSASGFWDDIRRHGVTASWSVMTIPAALMKQPERPDDADNPLRVMFGMGIDPNIWAAFERRFNVKFLNSFGSTETNLIIACPGAGASVPNRKVSGRATEDFEVAIVDENDNRLPPGATGFIVSRPRLPYTQMVGYYRMPDETLKATANLWMHNGDMGHVDEDGWFYFTGRGKDAMRIGGENVSAQEVEAVVDSHPAVLESAVFSVAGELGEDEIKADLRLKPDASVTPAEIIAFCRERMAKYMVPRYLQFRSELPRTGTQKIQKAKLKEQGLTPETWDSRRNQYLGNLPP